MKSSQTNKIMSTKSCAHEENVLKHLFFLFSSIVIEGARKELAILF